VVVVVVTNYAKYKNSFSKQRAYKNATK